MTRFTIRNMKSHEVSRVRELVISLQRLQNISHCPRLPSETQLFDDLCRTSEDNSLDKIANNNGTFTAVAIDNLKLKEPGEAYIVGYLIYTQAFSIIEGKHWYVNSFFIEEEYRRHGLGKKLMNFMQVHGSSIGIKTIDVPYMNNNVSGKKFYASLGAVFLSEGYSRLYKELH